MSLNSGDIAPAINIFIQKEIKPEQERLLGKMTECKLPLSQHTKSSASEKNILSFQGEELGDHRGRKRMLGDHRGRKKIPEKNRFKAKKAKYSYGNKAHCC